MLLCSRILKPGMVNFDAENKAVIEITQVEALQQGQEEESGESVEARNEARAVNKAAQIVEAAKKQADEILSEARADAASEQQKIQSAARAEAQQKLSEARDAGYREGMDAAIREGDAIKAEARKTLADAKAERKAMQEQLEPEIVGLITSITEKLLTDTVSINPAVVVNLVRQGLESTALTGNVKVYLSPNDLEDVLAHKDELLVIADGSVNLEFVKDFSLNPLDCIIETPFGDIDCSLGQQYETLRANLLYILNNRGS